MGTSAKAVANFFIRRHGRHGISPLKLQKLIYIAHGWSLALKDEPLVNDERPEAWKHGPVFPSVYYEFRNFGAKIITREATELADDLSIETPKVTDDRTKRLLDKVWQEYGQYSGSQLSRLTHKTGSPWHEARKRANGIRNYHINDEIIKGHYKNQIHD